MPTVANYLITFSGVVQGVGFRPHVYQIAQQMNLRGWVRNAGSSVEIYLQDANQAEVENLVQQIIDDAPTVSAIEDYRVEQIDQTELSLTGLSRNYTDFSIILSTASTVQQAHNISPDLATCPDCMAELLDPANRRYKYPFINCTNCGPRFTIVNSLPYDRANTTMSTFTMCAACQAEYDDPTNRRFHAQPNACPDCGPTLSVYRPTCRGDHWSPTNFSSIEDSEQSNEKSTDPIEQAAQAVLSGQIIAIKGIGGYNLVCDANNDDAIQRLRDFKHRQAKPFAICCRTVEDIEQLCSINDVEQAVLSGVERPIVLLRKKSESVGIISDRVAGNLAELGCMLPNNPVGILLMEAVQRPLVWTSGNISGEPIVADNDKAHLLLSPVTDLFLDHNRDIVNAYDDSVVRIVNGHIQFIRQSRGYAPVKLSLPSGGDESDPILAVGAQQKSTFALCQSNEVIVSQHLGDLDDLDAHANYQYTLELYSRLFDFPHDNNQIVHDLHPQYASTCLAKELAEEQKRPPKSVQHHEAHCWSVLGENLDFVRHPRVGGNPFNEYDKILCLAWDGTGYGTDGTIWGGEVFIASEESDWTHPDIIASEDSGDLKIDVIASEARQSIFTGSTLTRVSHLQNTPLLGGQSAVMSPATMAYSWLHTLDLMGKIPTGLAAHLGADKMSTLEAMTQSDTLQTSSMGRLFDAVSALLGICYENDYEGQGACELEAAAWSFLDSRPEINKDDYINNLLISDSEFYDFEVADGEFSPLKLIQYILDSFANGVDNGELALHFHIACLRLIRQVSKHFGAKTIAVSGGVFANKILSKYVEKMSDIKVLSHRKLPPNDACISFGQVAEGIFTDS